MPSDKPKSDWQESWAQSFEEGFYDNVDGAEDERKAVLVETDAQGRTKVVGVATGAEAEKIIADAQAQGVEVRQNAAQLESLIEHQQAEGATDIPAEVYDLMETIISFAQELGQEFSSRGSDTLPRAERLATEIEFSHEDVQSRSGIP